MTKHNQIQLFEEKKVRAVLDDVEEKWYFSVVDVVEVLTESPNPRNYWKVLKHRLKKEGNESVTNCNQLKLLAEDGKMRKKCFLWLKPNSRRTSPSACPSRLCFWH